MKPFTRDRFTLLTYFMLGFYAYMQAVVAPLMNYFRVELNLNYTYTVYHLSAFALGMTLAGVTTDKIAGRFGRGLTYWGGGLGMVLAYVGLLVAKSPVVSLLSVGIGSYIGSLLLITIQASLADHHGEQRAIPLTESNVVAVLASSCAPLLVSFGESNGLTWRFAVISWMVLWGVVSFLNRHVPIPKVKPIAHSVEIGGKLPSVFWLYIAVIFIGVSIEWSVTFWAGDFMEKVAGLDKATATSSLSVLLVAMMLGRAAGSVLARRFHPQKLLLAAALLVLFAFPLFWLGRVTWLNVVGLFLTGLGIANLFPMTLTMASAVGAHNPNTASARISGSAGVAIFVMPLLLGWVADLTNIFTAFGVVIPLALLVTGVIVYTGKQRREEI